MCMCTYRGSIVAYPDGQRGIDMNLGYRIDCHAHRDIGSYLPHLGLSNPVTLHVGNTYYGGVPFMV